MRGSQRLYGSHALRRYKYGGSSSLIVRPPEAVGTITTRHIQRETHDPGSGARFLRTFFLKAVRAVFVCCVIRVRS